MSFAWRGEEEGHQISLVGKEVHVTTTNWPSANVAPPLPPVPSPSINYT